MSTHKAAVIYARDKPLVVENVPRPVALTGDAIVRILAADIVPYMREVITNQRPYPLSIPMTPGNTAIARIHEVGPDCVTLRPGQLVFCDITIRARDNPAVTMLYGVHGAIHPAAQKLMDGVWRNGTYAEYARFPLENLYLLDEEVLLGQLGYSISDLCLLTAYLVSFGGLAEVDVKPGEVVIVVPATGCFGGGAVGAALAMGATVIAAGRNRAALDKLERIHGTQRLITVQITGDEATDTQSFKTAVGQPEGAHVYLDLSPPILQDSSLLVPYGEIMFKGIRIQGRFMYDCPHVFRLIQMVRSGLLPLGGKGGVTHIEEFGLDEIEGALDAAGRLSGWGGQVVLRP
ncbi:putative isopropanol dehydrogenase [Aspergillus vadensis CBS 113365]|uniref:Isopropanol dehydrogenase n=1 Tax=Aspergillus vadensis (strain CBS 113365 / IMI 142717 / IBT 24658) TaxID=1448311 RepID=A0A319ASS8_ASPVC|nr:isopropanol dehydrogenase [Aspergillus vadensis CBS 113365]PYH63386.1 isopropanol dehydrogenase [Aspergillus vadensis CBS 113365]